MIPVPALPQLAIVRVLTPGGPYIVGETLSLAFVSAHAGRLAPHEERPNAMPSAPSELPCIPEVVSVAVLRAADPFVCGDVLTLSFVDPNVARIQSRADAISPAGFGEELGPSRDVVATESAPPVDRSEPLASPPPSDRQPGLEEKFARVTAPVHTGVRVQLDWSADRARRFVQIVDKLFTVDRLGWYRHAIAMRLLLPDRIQTGDASADTEALHHLQALRAAAVETLGRPLLDAFMPNFSVTPDWLDGLDSPAAARGLAGLRDTIMPWLEEDTTIAVSELRADRTVGAVRRGDLASLSRANFEAFVPFLIPCLSPIAELGDMLANYRSALIESFGQTAQSAEAVRLNAMTSPNHSLDDRLWLLVGGVGEAFGGLAVA